MSRTHKRVKRNKREDFLRQNVDTLITKLVGFNAIPNTKLINEIIDTIRVLQADVFELQELVEEEQDRANEMAVKFYFLRKGRTFVTRRTLARAKSRKSKKQIHATKRTQSS